MNLTYRLTKISDLVHCVDLTRNQFAFAPDEYPDLVAMWRHLITEGMAISAVVIDRDRDAEDQLVGFGMSVFPTDEFMDEAGSNLPPYYARHIFDRWKIDPSELPLLDYAQIRHANSTDGLNIGVIHRGWVNHTAEMSPEEFSIGPKLYEVFAALHIGYRLNRLQVEVYGDVDKVRLMSFGYRCQTDYNEYFKQGYPAPPLGVHPSLMELTAAEVLQRPYNPTTPFYLRRQARLFFTPQEQALLQCALFGEKDQEIAVSLGISVSTVHKRWRTIFARAHDLAPSVLPSTGDDVRGPEKRSTLLRYLADHLEELRPVIRPKDPGNLTN